MLLTATRRFALNRFDRWTYFKQYSAYYSLGSNDSSEDKSQQSWWSGKNAWKIGCFTLGCSSLFAFRSGWRFKKRAALDLFLQQLSPHYEVVVYTNESVMIGGPVLAQMDPQGQFIHFRLFREATRYKGGKHIKDLSCLNRDLSRVVFVDWDPAAAQLQPRNSLIIKRWDGDESDRELIDLAAFLRMIAMGSVDDVRLVLDYYREFDDPLAFFREKHEELMVSQC
ncbi:unnamed protein product [Schistosoma margrebowiei]|uniref:Mitochondrial import inner membrane translocase subunit TIM50 n=1 Tax=Schistosoma margrebowiei TaxID=48269 RepID=A0A183MVF9_9TREM|nr:unnamed protein product [Schistosoma margrebowiei]